MTTAEALAVVREALDWVGDTPIDIIDIPKLRAESDAALALIEQRMAELEAALRHELGVTHGADTIDRLRTALNPAKEPDA